MDFMKWLNSLDELLYEVMSWLVFWPLTLWRTLVRPSHMMRYADRQLDLPQEEQYGDALSPPLFLALSLVIAHTISIGLGQPDELVRNTHGLAAFVSDETSALLLRLVIFSIFPLVAALRLVRRRRQPINRQTLRLPFYAQCYPAAAFALMLTIGTSFAAFPHLRTAGLILDGAALAYFFLAETRWFAERLAIGPGRALVAARIVLIEGSLIFMLAGFLFTR